MKKWLLTVALTLATVMVSEAKPIKGVVKDSKTGEPLIGTVVQVKGQKSLATTTGLDGSFKLSGLPDEGQVTLVISYISYKTKEVTVDVATANELNIGMDAEMQTMGEVVVTGFKSNRSDASAVQTVKNSAQVLNVMSQQTIQLSPDVNVAAALARVSGVTMEKDASGEASYAVLRGMDKRYNYTLVNGVKIPSPDDKNRYVPLNLFPSDLMDRLVVSKSLTPDMEGDAAGGVVNMDMKDAPAKFQLQANAALGYSDFFWDSDHDYLTSDRGNYTHKSPYEAHGSSYKATTSDFKDGPTKISSHSAPAPNLIAGVSVGNRFWNKRLGVLLAGSVQNTFRGTERQFNTASMASGEHTMSIDKLEKRYYSIHDLTFGLHGKVDLNLGNHKIEWYNMYVNKQQNTVRYTNSVMTSYGYDAETGSYTREDEVRSNGQNQQVFASHLKGTHHFTDRFMVDWSGVFSEAKEKDPDRTYVVLNNEVENNVVTKTRPTSMERRFQHNDDKDWAGYINLSYDTPIKSIDAVWKAGAMYRKKKRNNRYYSYQFVPTDISATLDGDDYSNFYGIDWRCYTPQAQASQLNYDSKELLTLA